MYVIIILLLYENTFNYYTTYIPIITLTEYSIFYKELKFTAAKGINFRR